MRLTLACACLLLAGCGDDVAPARNQGVASDFVPPAPQPPKPLAGQAHTTPLAAYVGHYPDEPVDGVGFFDRTEVATALDGAVTDPAIRRAIIHNEGPRTPIFRVGNTIATWGCEAHRCADHHWTLLIDQTSGKGEVCVQEAGRTRWHAGGPPTNRPEECPSEERQG